MLGALFLFLLAQQIPPVNANSPTPSARVDFGPNTASLPMTPPLVRSIGTQGRAKSLENGDQANLVPIDLTEVPARNSGGTGSADKSKNEGKPGKHQALLQDGKNVPKPIRKMGQLPPVKMTISYFDLLLDPVREANLLLPENLDPIGDDPNWLPNLVPETEDATDAKIKPSEQQKWLGTSLAPRDDTPDELAKWKYRIETGGSFRQGNTSTMNVHSLLKTERHSQRSEIVGRVGLDYNETGSQRPNRRASGEILMDRNLRGRWIWYSREELEYDEVKLIDLRSVTSAGLGFRFIDKLDRRLIVRSGPTLSYILYDPAAHKEDTVRSGWLVESDYRRVLWDSARFEWTLSMFPDFDKDQSFRVRNQAALLFPIGGKASPWNWKLGVRQEYQLDPVNQTNSSDVEGYFSISYAK